MENDGRHGTAIVFPGMGPSRFADVGKFMVINPLARRLVELADETLGYPLVERFRAAEGDYSEYAQVAFLVNCLAMAQWAETELGMVADVCTGPSFGEKPMAAYAGSLTAERAVWMTARIARCMEEYFRDEHQDVVTQSFVRTPEARLREILGELDEAGEWYEISCHLDDDFHMLSLRESRLEWLLGRLRAGGGLPLYAMRPPMHCAAFGALRDRVEAEVFAELDFADPALPVVSAQDGGAVTTADGVRTLLLDSFVRPLRWPAAVAALEERGVRTAYVVGPDSLFGRVGTTTRTFDVVQALPKASLMPRFRPSARS
ncbi:ACP S-malonyltransferase [Streptomyces sp. NPDC093065]|uniref:ACP S-malonyltransferase n=1 Tax=Streptomyces sp. NPDC093065 TaxID=3366021 RepID=UPI0038031320